MSEPEDITPSNSILKNILRILTLEEVAGLTKEFVAFNKVALTDVLCETLEIAQKPQEIESENSNVIPINIASTNKTEIPITQGNLALKVNTPEVSEDEKVIGGINFLLDEKKKCMDSNYKLKGMKVRELYKQNSDVDLEQIKVSSKKGKKKKKDNSSNSFQQGVLIDKDHY